MTKRKHLIAAAVALIAINALAELPSLSSCEPILLSGSYPPRSGPDFARLYADWFEYAHGAGTALPDALIVDRRVALMLSAGSFGTPAVIEGILLGRESGSFRVAVVEPRESKDVRQEGAGEVTTIRRERVVAEREIPAKEIARMFVQIDPERLASLSLDPLARQVIAQWLTYRRLATERTAEIDRLRQVEAEFRAFRTRDEEFRRDHYWVKHEPIDYTR